MARQATRNRKVQSGEVIVRARQAVAIESEGQPNRFVAGDEFIVSDKEAARFGDHLLEIIPAFTKEESEANKSED